MQNKRYVPNTLLREARTKRGWSQNDLATLIGGGKTTVQSWESGRRFPLPRQRVRLCQIFGLPPEKLGFSSFSPSPDKLPIASDENLLTENDGNFQNERFRFQKEEKRPKMLRCVQRVWVEGVLQYFSRPR